MELKEVNHQTHLDGTIKLLTGDLGEAASRAGLDNHLQRWIEVIKAANNPALHAIITDLQALKAHFGSGTLETKTIADLLTRLGHNTAQAAHFADGNTASRVEKLGEVLAGVGQHLLHGAPQPSGDLPQDMSSH